MFSTRTVGAPVVEGWKTACTDLVWFWVPPLCLFYYEKQLEQSVIWFKVIMYTCNNNNRRDVQCTWEMSGERTPTKFAQKVGRKEKPESVNDFCRLCGCKLKIKYGDFGDKLVCVVRNPFLTMFTHCKACVLMCLRRNLGIFWQNLQSMRKKNPKCTPAYYRSKRWFSKIFRRWGHWQIQAASIANCI